MDLWQIYVFAHTRLCLNISYDYLHHMANYDTLFRQILGIETDYGFEKLEVEYQNIIDNVNLLDEATLLKINALVVEMGHGVFKKKEMEALRLKTDSFVVESNVHFPTDYNLLWDSARKCIDCIEKYITEHKETTGWRNLEYWYKTLKSGMRAVGQVSKTKSNNKKEIIENYLEKARYFSQKVKNEYINLLTDTLKDVEKRVEIMYYIQMLDKHIDLLERREIKDEKIPHSEKVFSIFEPYTEWITKGKQHPSVELGKNVQITTDQYHLIIDHQIMENEVDKSVVISLVKRILEKNKVESWSFDKGYYSAINKEELSQLINKLVLPKKGKLTLVQREEEQEKDFKKLRRLHSAIESNINELEHKGLDRCPDRGYLHFKRYIALGVCAYNLHRIGAELMKQEKQKQEFKKAA